MLRFEKIGKNVDRALDVVAAKVVKAIDGMRASIASLKSCVEDKLHNSTTHRKSKASKKRSQPSQTDWKALLRLMVGVVMCGFALTILWDTRQDTPVRTGIQVVTYNDSLLWNENETTLESDASMSLANLVVTEYINGDHIVGNLTPTDSMQINGTSVTATGNNLIVTITGLGVEGERYYTVTDSITGTVITGSFVVEYDDLAVSVDDFNEASDNQSTGSTGSTESTAHKGHYLVEEPHIAENRDISGLTTGIVDNHELADTSGTVEGEQKIEEDPYLHYEEDLGLQKDSELPEQEVTVVEKPKPQPTATPQPTPVPTVEPTPIPTVEPTPIPTQVPTPTPEATVAPEPTATPEVEQTPETPKFSTSVGTVVVLDENDIVIKQYFADGSGTQACYSADEFHIVENGDGTANSDFGLLRCA